MNALKRILVLSRTTRSCGKAVHFAIKLAAKFDASLLVVHSVHNPFRLEGWDLPMPFLSNLEKEYKQAQAQARKDIDQMISGAVADGLQTEVIMVDGEISKEAIQLVAERKIDLMIVRAHQEWRIEHFLFGRSNEKLVRELPCSVLLVKDEPKPA